MLLVSSDHKRQKNKGRRIRKPLCEFVGCNELVPSFEKHNQTWCQYGRHSQRNPSEKSTVADRLTERCKAGTKKRAFAPLLVVAGTNCKKRTIVAFDCCGNEARAESACSWRLFWKESTRREQLRLFQLLQRELYEKGTICSYASLQKEVTHEKGSCLFLW